MPNSHEIPLFGNDTEQPTCCPTCGSRTVFTEAHGQQLHWCLNEQCKMIFRTEDDEDEDDH